MKSISSALKRCDYSIVNNVLVNQQARKFFAYLRIAFNKVDEHRLQEVGPDRLCAEW